MATSGDLQKLWREAQVANLLAVSDSQSGHEIGAFSITSNLPLIFSLDPANDFEVSNRDINGWKLIFVTADGQVLGTAGYFKAIGKLRPYILDEQNNSILVRALSPTELEKLFQKTTE